MTDDAGSKGLGGVLSEPWHTHHARTHFVLGSPLIWYLDSGQL